MAPTRSPIQTVISCLRRQGRDTRVLMSGFALSKCEGLAADDAIDGGQRNRVAGQSWVTSALTFSGTKVMPVSG